MYFPSRAVEHMRYERASHIVIVHFPKSAHLCKFTSFIAYVLYRRLRKRTDGHECIFKHSRNIVLEHLLIYFYYVLSCHHVGSLRHRILVYEDALGRELRVISNPYEVVRLFLELVATGSEASRLSFASQLEQVIVPHTFWH